MHALLRRLDELIRRRRGVLIDVGIANRARVGDPHVQFIGGAEEPGVAQIFRHHRRALRGVPVAERMTKLVSRQDRARDVARVIEILLVHKKHPGFADCAVRAGRRVGKRHA